MAKSKKTMSGSPDYSHKAKGESLTTEPPQEPQIVQVLGQLNLKLFDIVRAQAVINSLNQDKRAITAENVQILLKQDAFQLQINKILTHIIGEKRDDQQGVEAGNLDEAGYFGLNPQAIRNVIFKNGNLRERIYLLYRDGYSGFTDKIFSDPNKIKQINQILPLIKANWLIDTDQIAAITAEGQANSPYKRGIYSRFVRDEKLREQRSKSEQQKWQQENNPAIIDDQQRSVPLSQREKIAKTGESPNTTLFGYQAKKKDPYISGSAFYKASAVPHPYLDMSREIGETFWAGASGMTDTILTFAVCVGATKQELLALREAARITMAEDRSHSPHEVYYAAKSFGLPYTPGELSISQEHTSSKKKPGA